MADFLRKMLNEIRNAEMQKDLELPKSETINEADTLNNRFKILMEEAVTDVKKKPLRENKDDGSEEGEPFVVRKTDVQFGSTRQTQETTIRKTVGDVEFKQDALKYYPKIKDLVINGELNGLGLTFQFRYKDPSGDGCYIWADGLQLTDTNAKTVSKIRDCFLNWKQTLVDDGDLMEKLHKASTKE
jgi:hypothetical protein